MKLFDLLKLSQAERNEAFSRIVKEARAEREKKSGPRRNGEPKKLYLRVCRQRMEAQII